MELISRLARNAGVEILKPQMNNKFRIKDLILIIKIYVHLACAPRHRSRKKGKKVQVEMMTMIVL